MGYDTVQLTQFVNGYSLEILDCRGASGPRVMYKPASQELTPTSGVVQEQFEDLGWHGLRRGSELELDVNSGRALLRDLVVLVHKKDSSFVHLILLLIVKAYYM